MVGRLEAHDVVDGHQRRVARIGDARGRLLLTQPRGWVVIQRGCPASLSGCLTGNCLPIGIDFIAVVTAITGALDRSQHTKSTRFIRSKASAEVFHKFKIGQHVEYSPPRGNYAPRGMYLPAAQQGQDRRPSRNRPIENRQIS